MGLEWRFLHPDSPPEIRTFSNEKVRIFYIYSKNRNFFEDVKNFDCNRDCNGGDVKKSGKILVKNAMEKKEGKIYDIIKVGYVIKNSTC